MRRGIIAAGLRGARHPLAQYVAAGGFLLDTKSALSQLFTDLGGTSPTSANGDPIGSFLSLSDGALIAAVDSAQRGQLLNGGGVPRIAMGGYGVGLRGNFKLPGLAIPVAYYFVAVYKFDTGGSGTDPLGAAYLLNSTYGGGAGEGNWQFSAYNSPGLGRFAVTEGGWFGGGTLAPSGGSPEYDGAAGWVEAYREAGTHSLRGSTTIGGAVGTAAGANPSKTMSAQSFDIGASSSSSAVGMRFELAFMLYSPGLPDADGRDAIRQYIADTYAGGW